MKNNSRAVIKLKKVLFVFLLCLLSIVFLPVKANAADVIYSGNCGANGNNVQYTIDSEGVLTIFGEGEMKNVDYWRNAPFKNYASQIKHIVIEEGVTNIGGYAFYDLSSCEDIVIPKSVVACGGYNSFNYCSSLTEVYYSGTTDDWIESGIYGFYKPYNLYFESESGYSLVTNLNDVSRVNTIKARAFYKCRSLTEVTIPDGVVSIEDYAFYLCSNVNSITIPSSVKSIGVESFSGCSLVQNIQLPTGVEKIGDQCFAGTSIEEIAIPDSVIEMGGNIFNNCNSLKTITLPKNAILSGRPFTVTSNTVLETVKGYDGSSAYRYCGNPSAKDKYSWVSLGKVDHGKCGEEISWTYRNGVLRLLGTGEMDNFNYWSTFDVSYIDISEGITSIGKGAFSGLDIEDINIPNTVLAIGERAFSGCKNLTQVSIPESISAINDYTFSDCSSLQRITIPESVISVGINAFWSCSKLAEVNGMSNVQTIGQSAFYGCSQLEEIELPTSLTSIGLYAFGNCGLIEIDIPNGASVGMSAFEGCSNFKKIEFGSGTVFHYSNQYFWGTQLEEIYYRGTIEDFINSGADMTGFTTTNNVVVPAKLFVWDDQNEFYLLEHLKPNDNVTKIPNGMFEGYSYLLDVELSEKVESIGDLAFYCCNNIESITLNEGLVSIGTWALSTNSSKLTEIIVPATVETFTGESVFDTNATLVVYDSTPALQYAIDNNYTYRINENEIMASAVQLNKTSLEIKEGEDYSLVVSIVPSSTTNKKITWSSSDPTVAFVSQQGVIVAKKEGNTVISATASNGVEATCSVTVNKNIPLTGIQLNEAEEVNYGSEYRPVITYIPSNTTDSKTAMWQSSDESVFTVSEDGVVTPVALGTATLTATVGNFSATSEITVAKGIPEYTLPEGLRATCEQKLSEISLPSGFSWIDSANSVGRVGSTIAGVVFTPEDEEHYNIVSGLLVTIQVDHKYNEKWSSNGSGHWHECACGEKSEVSDHIYGDWTVTTIPTCTMKGEKERTCSVCGYINKAEIEANGHEWASGYTVDKEASCTEEGTKSIHCSVCDAIDESTVEAIPKIDHKYGAWKVTKEAACTEDGSKEKVCSVCEDKVTEVIPATGHKWNEEYTVDKEATCTEEGSKSIHCSVCNAVDDATVTVIPKSDHTYGEWNVTKEATCTEDGSKEKVCSVCEDKVTEVIPATGHKWNEEYTVDKEATCTEEGSKSIHCSKCGESTEVTSIPALGHEWDGGSITTEPTCTEVGVKTFTCKRCEETRTEPVEATGHTFSEEFTVDKEATCTEEGSKSKHCLKCEAVTETTSIPALGHSFGEWVEVTASTCENPGLRQHTCEVCGTVESENLDPNGHDWEDDFTVDKEATCTEDGSQSKHCKNCDAVTDSQVIPAHGHSYGDWNIIKDATCDSAGSQERNCDLCKAKETANIPALGHIWNEQPTVDKAATCTESGSQSIHCARCNETKNEEVIPALGHDWNSEPIVEKVATCTEDGAESIHCSRCDAVKEGSEKAIPKTGHKFSAWKTTKAATEIAAGQKTRTCSVCGHAEKQTIAMLKPTLPAVKITTPKAAKKAATIKWKKVSKKNQKKIAKIQIQYSLDKSFKTGVKTVTAKKTAASKKITKLKSKKTYYVRIRAYKKSGEAVHVSKWSAIKKVKVK